MLSSVSEKGLDVYYDNLLMFVPCCLFPGSLLLDSLLSYLTTKEYNNCKATYLHVLSTNHNAIRFYERRNFRAHSYLPYYYSIQGKPRDGYSYVLYINGGQPPWSILYPFIVVFCYIYYWINKFRRVFLFSIYFLNIFGKKKLLIFGDACISILSVNVSD